MGVGTHGVVLPAVGVHGEAGCAVGAHRQGGLGALWVVMGGSKAPSVRIGGIRAGRHTDASRWDPSPVRCSPRGLIWPLQTPTPAPARPDSLLLADPYGFPFPICPPTQHTYVLTKQELHFPDC